MKKCDICGATPTRGTFPNLVLCPTCCKAFLSSDCDNTIEVHPQEVLPDHAAQMARIDAARPDWHATVYGGCKR